jgi:predicted DNA-binding ArsR family transcriptional regulator
MDKVSNSNENKWITLKEASQIMGKNAHAIRMLIKRNRIVNVKKIQQNGRDSWLIHQDEVMRFGSPAPSHVNDEVNVTNVNLTDPSHVNLITVEYYDHRKKEWDLERDQLMQGLMMYRFKFEEADRVLKLLPAPAEVVSSRLEDLERTLQEKDEVIKAELDYREQLSHALHEQETRIIEKDSVVKKLEAELEEERKRPWWKKLFKK